MSDLEKHIDELLGNDPQRHYFLACSGGVDSMVLLHILVKLKKRVSVLHVNYLLRGEDSELDQQLIESVCLEKGIPCHVKRVDLNRYLTESGGNLQDQARKVRYSYFGTFKLKSDFRIVLAHHADDQVETFFLNLARGGSIMGLSCMLKEHQGYMRPLLDFSKEEILFYAEKNKIHWREDSSNATSKYNRNKLRNIILPDLKKQIPELQESVLHLVKVFQTTQSELERSLKSTIERINDTGILSFSEYDVLNEFEIHEIIRELEIPAGTQHELLKLRNSIKGKEIYLGLNNFERILVEQDHFYFEKPLSLKELPELNLESVSSLPTVFTKDEIYLDPDKINGHLKLRYWKDGDRIKPVGLNGSKLISDILTDAKLPHHVKKHQLVLEDNDKILWCVGHSVTREAIATEKSEKIKIWLS